jgi:hypothetical protein
VVQQQQQQVVSHYGIHWDQDKVAWLEQGRSGVNVYGLHQKSPFIVRSSGGKHCNHQINLSTPIPNDRHWEKFLELQTDPLVRAMMPFPKPDAGVYYLEDNPRLTDYLVMLSRMSSPIYPVVVPFWTFEMPGLVKALSETNVQPLALYGASIGDISTVREIATPAQHRPRKLIMTGIKEIVLPTVVRKIETELTDCNKHDFNELNALPWEALGAAALKKYMRSEWQDAKTQSARAIRAPLPPTEPARVNDRSERAGAVDLG